MGEDLRFERPHAALRDSYRDLVREFAEHGEPPIPFVLTYPNDDFQAFLDRLAAAERGEGLPAGFVPHSTFWLVRNTTVVVAVSNLRHRLTDGLRVEGGNIGYGVRPGERRRGYATEILRHTLRAARDVGLDEVLLTCARANMASVRTILRCGGELRSEAYLPQRGEIVQRYAITTPGRAREQ
jgi:predicted acetyltransferase